MSRTTTLGTIDQASFARFPSGVAAIAALGDGEPDAMVVSSFTVGASFDPPMVTFSARQQSSTWARLREAPVIGVSVLGSTHGALCRQLSSRTRSSRFVDVAHTLTSEGAVLIDGSPLQLECVVHREVVAGDHVVVLLQVMSADTDRTVSPLVYHDTGFHSLQPIG